MDAPRGVAARLVLAVGALAVSAVVASTPPDPQTAATPHGDVKRGQDAARRLCIGCHPFTPPDVLPRAAWRGEMVKMALIVEGRGMPGWGEPPPKVVLTPDYEDVLAYYEAKAPVALPAPEPWPPPAESPVRFVRRTIGFPEALTPEPAVANVRIALLNGEGRPDILACDMRQGLVLRARALDAEPSLVPLAQIAHPAHVSVVDLDGDGRRDLLVADLGEFFPGDHERGAAVWLRALPGGGFAPTTTGGFPRVADVEAGDFDADGRLDLVVAGFGWWKKGQIAVLLNRPGAGGSPSFERTIVDRRAGPIHVVPTDLDGDGRLDFVALVAQEHEAVVAFLGDGKGGFRAQPLYAAPHPNWGSSGLQLADLDGDGDLDVIVTNGDMFDDDILKPYHGVQWLENRGRLRFEPHSLARLAGAHRAVAADVDRDGDSDVVASAFTGVAGSADTRLPALVWLEQVKRARFVPHTIAVGRPSYPTLDVGDVDGDGDLDVVTGNFVLQGQSATWVDVWRNEGRASAAAPGRR